MMYNRKSLTDHSQPKLQGLPKYRAEANCHSNLFVLNNNLGDLHINNYLVEQNNIPVNSGYYYIYYGYYDH